MSLANDKIHLGEGRTVGGLPPGSPETMAAVERVGKRLNPNWHRIKLEPIGEPIAKCIDCGCNVSRIGGRCKRCASTDRVRRIGSPWAVQHTGGG